MEHTRKVIAVCLSPIAGAVAADTTVAVAAGAAAGATAAGRNSVAPNPVSTHNAPESPLNAHPVLCSQARHPVVKTNIALP